MRCKNQTKKISHLHQSFQANKDKNNFAGLRKWKNDQQETSKRHRQNAEDQVRAYEKDFFGQLLVKYSKKIFWVERCQEDIILCWLSMLEYQMEFPIRFFLMQNPLQKKRSGKDLWFETQFLLPSGTANEESLVLEQNLQKKFCRFFTEGLIPAIQKFKNERINWECMMLQEYEDEVGQQIDNEIIKKINNSFRVYCQ